MNISISDELVLHEKNYDEILEKVSNDPFAKFLGFEIIEFSAGKATVQVKIKEFMLNAHETVHGGLLFTLADFAFAIACNSYGKVSVGLSTTAHFMKSAKKGDIIAATAVEERRNNRTGFYRITITHNSEIISTVDAICYRKNRYFVSKI